MPVVVLQQEAEALQPRQAWLWALQLGLPRGAHELLLACWLSCPGALALPCLGAVCGPETWQPLAWSYCWQPAMRCGPLRLPEVA